MVAYDHIHVSTIALVIPSSTAHVLFLEQWHKVYGTDHADYSSDILNKLLVVNNSIIHVQLFYTYRYIKFDCSPVLRLERNNYTNS